MPPAPVYLSDFAEDILVRCPRCESCAHLLPTPGYGWKLACGACGLARDWISTRGRGVPQPGTGPRLGGFNLNLWLTASCGGEDLWAYNQPHIEFLRSFVGAPLRPHARSAVSGRANQSLQSRLPRWMLAKHHRATVLKGLDELTQKLPATV